MPGVELFFDYLSPYAYLVWPRIRRVCEARSVELSVYPVLLAGLLNRWGQLGPAEIPPKMLFVFKDTARFAALHGIAFHAPRFHPFNPLTALRVSLREVAGGDQFRIIDALFSAGWGQGKDLGSAESLIEILDAAGFDGAALVSRSADPAVKSALRASTDGAIERGVFGVPTMLVGDELFWGNDQIDNVDRRLSGSDPIANLDLSTLAGSGPSAERKRPKG